MGARHAFILKELGYGVHIVSKRSIKHFPCYKSINEAFQSNGFDYVIISNETNNHYNSLILLNELGYSGKLLIEKPVFSEPSSLSQSGFENVFVAYNLRFHPIIQKLYMLLRGKEIYSIQVYVGQYLPDWRPGSDYTKCYSATNAKGGGALRDLSHELDYMNWLCGRWQRVAAIGGKFSDLEIDSDDIFILLLEMENCPVACVQMNYLDRRARREIIINLKDHSIKADLILNTMEIDDGTAKYETEKNSTYITQHQAILDDDYNDVCTLEQGVDVLKLIHAAEISAEKKVWINRRELEAMP